MKKLLILALTLPCISYGASQNYLAGVSIVKPVSIMNTQELYFGRLSQLKPIASYKISPDGNSNKDGVNVIQKHEFGFFKLSSIGEGLNIKIEGSENEFLKLHNMSFSYNDSIYNTIANNLETGLNEDLIVGGTLELKQDLQPNFYQISYTITLDIE